MTATCSPSRRSRRVRKSAAFESTALDATGLATAGLGDVRRGTDAFGAGDAVQAKSKDAASAAAARGLKAPAILKGR